MENCSSLFSLVNLENKGMWKLLGHQIHNPKIKGQSAGFFPIGG